MELRSNPEILCVVRNAVGELVKSMGFPEASDTLRFATKILGLAAPSSVYAHFNGLNSPLEYPNAHRVGKNDRAGTRKFCLRKIYIP